MSACEAGNGGGSWRSFENAITKYAQYTEQQIVELVDGACECECECDANANANANANGE